GWRPAARRSNSTLTTWARAAFSDAATSPSANTARPSSCSRPPCSAATATRAINGRPCSRSAIICLDNTTRHCPGRARRFTSIPITFRRFPSGLRRWRSSDARSEEHTSELQSQSNLVCRLLLEKKNEMGSASAQLQGAGRTVVHLAVGGKLVGLIAIADAGRPTAVEAIKALRARGVEIVLLTAD